MARKRNMTPFKYRSDYPIRSLTTQSSEDWTTEETGEDVLPIRYPFEPTEREYFERRDVNVDGGKIDTGLAVVGGLLALSVVALFYAKNKNTTL